MSIGAIGGVDWGGASIDFDHGYAITNVANMPTMITVIKTAGRRQRQWRSAFRVRQCALCRQ